MRVRLSNLSFVNGVLEVDVILGAGPVVPPPTPQPEPTPTPTPQPQALPEGYDRDKAVAFSMLFSSMQRSGLTPVGVQGRGGDIVNALNADYPGLNVYLSKTDAPVWPGFGSLDVTIDSGKGGWQFRPDGVTPYEYDPAKRG